MEQSILDKLMQVLGRKTPQQEAIQKFKKSRPKELKLVVRKVEGNRIEVKIPDNMHAETYKKFMAEHKIVIDEFINSNKIVLKL